MSIAGPAPDPVESNTAQAADGWSKLPHLSLLNMGELKGSKIDRRYGLPGSREIVNQERFEAALEQFARGWWSPETISLGSGSHDPVAWLVGDPSGRSKSLRGVATGEHGLPEVVWALAESTVGMTERVDLLRQEGDTIYAMFQRSLDEFVILPR